MNENLKAERDSALLFVSLAEEFLNNGSYEEAVNYCNMALNQFPDLKEAMMMLARTYSRMDDKPSLTAVIEKLKAGYADDEQVKALLEGLGSEQPQQQTAAVQPSAQPETPPEIKPQSEPIAESLQNIPPDETVQEETSEVISADEAESMLNNALNEINEIKGVLGSIIIEEAGIIIKEKVTKGLDAEVAAALFSTIFMVSEDSVSRIQLGLMDRIFIEVGKVRIYLFKGSGYIVGIFTEEIVKIGLIHVKAKQLIRDIKKVLG